MNNRLPSIEQTKARARKDFADQPIGLVFEACWPVYHLKLVATLLESSDLSATARFMLRLVDLGVKQPEELARLLGLSKAFIVTAASELLLSDSVAQLPNHALVLTDKGRRYLTEGRFLKPKRLTIHVAYDPLTKRALNLDVGNLAERELVRKEGRFVIPGSTRKPRLTDIKLAEVRAAVQGDAKVPEPSDLLELTEIKDAILKYRSDIVLVRVGDNSKQQQFAAYRSAQLLQEETAAVQRLIEKGINLVPEDLMPPQDPQPWLRAPGVSPEEADALEEIDRLDGAIGAVEEKKEDVQLRVGATQLRAEQEELQRKYLELEAEKNELAKNLREREAALLRANQGAARLIRTEDHHPLLLRAIKEAEHDLVLVSAWIDPYAMDREICQLLASAISRGVVVRIGWGLGANAGRGGEAQRNREKGETVLRELRKLLPTAVKGRLAVKRTETHEKFIICDERFCAFGSFNWLSYRGERDRAYKRETSLYSERTEDIRLWQENAKSLFGSAWNAASEH